MYARAVLVRACSLAVLVVYVWFGSAGTFAFRRVPWEREPGQGFTERYYAAQAEAFLRGQLDLPYPRDPRWDQVLNAYDFGQRDRLGLAWEMWDASYYNNKFYLYFSPVPALLFYLPFRLAAGAYPPDNLVATFACAWAFLASVAFARRALGGKLRALWVLLLGLGNAVPFVLTDGRAYEVAVATGMALTATFACALLRWFETRATAHAVWMTVWLALAIATRPNLAVLLLIAALVLFRHQRAALFATIPLGVTGVAYAIYNMARFGSPFELGMTYQISYVPMWRAAPCSLCSVPDAIRLANNVIHYVFWPPSFASDFPYVDLQRSVLDRAISYAGGAEQIAGIAALNPLALIGSAIALVYALRRGPADERLRAATTVMAAAWLILLGLATCRWVTARYALDFTLLMTAASVVCIECALAELERVDVRVRVLAAVMAVSVCYSVASGVLAGVRGPNGIFAKKLFGVPQERPKQS